jgi:hypothetical protein
MAPTTINVTVEISEFRSLFHAKAWRTGFRAGCLKHLFRLDLGDSRFSAKLLRRQIRKDYQIPQMNDIHYFMSSQTKCQVFSVFAALSGEKGQIKRSDNWDGVPTNSRLRQRICHL